MRCAVNCGHTEWRGEPQQNACIRRFNRTVRYECLAQYGEDGLAQIRDFATRRMWHHNHERPGIALDELSPEIALSDGRLTDPASRPS
jgi:putative transposase